MEKIKSSDVKPAAGRQASSIELTESDSIIFFDMKQFTKHG